MAVGWYLRYSLSYRDVEDLMQKRGLSCASLENCASGR